jgi:uncharacterized protein YycO
MENDIESGDVGLVRRYATWNPLSWISAAVRFFTGSRWNHAIAFIELPQGLFVIEAVETGVRMCSYYNWKQKYGYDLLVIRYCNPEFSKHEIEKRLIFHLGKPYDFTALINHQVVFQVARWFGNRKWIGRTNKSGADEQIYCSELIAIAYNFEKWWTYTAEDLRHENHQVIYEGSSR